MTSEGLVTTVNEGKYGMAVRRMWACATFLILHSSLFMTPVCAQEDKDNQLNVEFELLTQGEIRDGGVVSNSEWEKEKPEDRTNFVIERSRFIVTYLNKSQLLELRFVPQHQGVWGQSGKGSFNIYEGWGKLSAKCGLFAQIGRQALSYDDERIIGPNDWSMAGISHDVLKLGYEGKGHQVHLVLAYNQNAETIETGGTYYTNGAQPYKTMHTLWYHYDVPKFPFGASFLLMNLGMQGGEDGSERRTRYQQLFGTYLTFTPKYGTFEGSYYRQTGKEEHGMDMDAWMASIKAEWKPTERWSLDAGFDYLSGDKYFAVPHPGQSGLTRHTKMQGFCPVYGSHHKFYGSMDFFYISTYVNGFSPGLQNAFFGGSITPIKDLTFKAHYHYMATATKLSSIDMTLGHVVELEASFKLRKDAELSAGFSYMTGTESMERLKRASDDGSLRWGWLSLKINPTLFTSKW
ncbi:MAG: hypothetical protein J5545_00485 [Bacteroidaceae bacterium]|nr:hypothetical protein [Bacteroidaceae bacterium]